MKHRIFIQVKKIMLTTIISVGFIACQNNSSSTESNSAHSLVGTSITTTSFKISTIVEEGEAHWDLSKDIVAGTPLNGAHFTVKVERTETEDSKIELSFSNPAIYANSQDLQVKEVSFRYNNSLVPSAIQFSGVDFVVSANTAQYLSSETLTYIIENEQDSDTISFSFATLSPYKEPIVDVGNTVDISIGSTIYNRDCLGCHASIDFNNIDPNRYNKKDIQTAIQQIPQMSLFQGKFSDSEIESIAAALVHYTQTP